MLKRSLVIIIHLFVIFITAHAQQVEDVKEVRVKTDSLQLIFQFHSPSIVRVIKFKATDPYRPQKNYSIVDFPKDISVKKIAKGQQIDLYTDSLRITVDKRTGALRFSRGNELIVLEDTTVQPQFGDLRGKKDAYRIKQGFILDKDESVYGLGQHQKGKMNQRNQVLPLYQKNMEVAMPIMQSIKGYGILWNNESPSLFVDTLSQTYFMSDKGQSIDYFFIWGGRSDAVVAGIRTLSGRSPLLPKWTFGFAQSRERYKSQEELVGVVKEYRRRGVPLDCIVQDWQYWGTDFNDWNSTRFDNPTYNKAQEMIDSIHNLHAKIIISVWPSFGPNTAIYKDLEKEGFLYSDRVPDFPKEARVFNVFNSKARDKVWGYMHDNLFSKGMDGWWLDATEPFEKYDFEKFSGASYFRQLAPLLNHTSDTVVSVLNSFPLYTIGGVVDNQRKVTADKRAFILTRSGYIGQQRYGSILWSGDITSSWQVMKNQISGALNLGLSGVPYWNADIGGFWSNRYYPKGHTDPAFRELVVRWIQFGTFTALMRLHGTNTPREIYQYGEKGYWAYDATEKFINLRYRLLPYTYATSYQIMKNQESLMRPLFADYKTDKLTHNINDQFLYGKSFLIAPVVESQYVDTVGGSRKEDFTRTKSRKVYLPKGSEWFDFWIGNKFSGGQYVSHQTPIDIMPIYVKSGSIIPLGEFKQYSGEKKDDTREIRIYAGANGYFQLYEDEGDNYNYEQGKFSTIDFRWDDQKRKLYIGDTTGEYDGMLTNRVFNIVLVDQSKGVGINPSPKTDKVVQFKSNAVEVSF